MDPLLYDPLVAFPGCKFEKDWTSKVVPVFEEYVLPLGRRQRILEIGCYEGRTTCYLAEKVLSRDGGRLVCVDPFDYEPTRRFTGESDYRTRASHDVWGDSFKDVEGRFLNNYGNVKSWLYKEARDASVHWWRQCSRGYLGNKVTAGGDPFDLIFIDGSHLLADVTLDLFLCMHFVKEGSIIVVDDFPDYVEGGFFPKTKEAKEVFDACHHFRKAFSKRIEVLHYSEPAAVFKVTK